MKVTSKERTKANKVWTRVFGLRVGDKVRVHRGFDTPFGLTGKTREGVIRAFVTEGLGSHWGPYIVSIRGETFNGDMFCREEELEKIEDSKED